MTRRALVTSNVTLDRVRAYLPNNYSASVVGRSIVISGHDHAGWTLDGYVLPRLASGLIFASEVNLGSED